MDNITGSPRNDNRLEDWVNLLLGCSLFISPFTLRLAIAADYSPILTAAVWNAITTGTVIVVVTTMAMFQVKPWKEWIIAAVGIWVAASPWTLGFSNQTVAMWNSVVIGLLIFCLASWTVYEISTASIGEESSPAGANRPTSVV